MGTTLDFATRAVFPGFPKVGFQVRSDRMCAARLVGIYLNSFMSLIASVNSAIFFTGFKIRQRCASSEITEGSVNFKSFQEK